MTEFPKAQIVGVTHDSIHLQVPGMVQGNYDHNTRATTLTLADKQAYLMWSVLNQALFRPDTTRPLEIQTADEEELSA